MRIFVVNADPSVDRWQLIQARMRRLGLPFERFAAVDPHDGFAFFERYDERRFIIGTGRRASPDEAGRYASHLELWKRCIELAEPILILEDHAELRSGFAQTVGEATRLVPIYGFITLQALGPKSRTRPILQLEGMTLGYCMKCACSTIAYALSPRTAAVFVSRSQRLASPLDLFLGRFWRHGQPLFALEPPSVTAEPSRTPNTKRRRVDLRVRSQRALLALQSAIARTRFNRAFLSGRLDTTPASDSAEESEAPATRGSQPRGCSSP